MEDNKEILLDYLLNDLSSEEKTRIEKLIQRDPNWHEAYLEIASAVELLHREDLKSWDVPIPYWNGFLPRFYDRVERKQQKRAVVKRRIYYAIPAVGLAVLLLFFTHIVMDTNNKIDYLLDNSAWISTGIAPETSSSYESLAAKAEKYLGDNGENSLTDQLKDLSPGSEGEDMIYEFKDLSNEEQKELLSALETTTII